MEFSRDALKGFAKRLEDEPELRSRFQADPIETLEQEAGAPAYQRDVWVYRMVVGVLGLVLLIVVVASLVLSLQGQTEIPAVLVALGSGALGALAGLLAPSPVRS